MAFATMGAGLVLALGAGAALAALPRTYQVQRVDSPNPVSNGRFGLALLNVGDVNADGEADLLTGTDKHGTVSGVGQVTVLSGEDGSVLRTYALPDTADPGGGGDRPTGFGNALAFLPDIGSCADSPAPAPGTACASTSATSDGVPEQLVAASGLDVADNETFNNLLDNSLGVVYVFDGATGALLKRLLMPQADRDEQDDVFDQDPRFGRTLLSPGDLVDAAGNLGSDGKADILVGATDYSETKANSHPESPCFDQLGAENCTASGRIYLYSGAAVLTGGAGTPLEMPAKTIKNPLSLPDDPAPISPFVNSEGFGTLLIPVGDSGSCTSAVPADPAGACATTSNTGDSMPEFATAIPGFDLFGMEEVGAAMLIDGAKLSNVKQTDYVDPRPEASWGQAQNGTVYPAVGDLVGSTAPDFYMPDIQWGGYHAAQGRGLVVDGRPSTRGSFREFPSRFMDPTPQTGEQFGLAAAGLGNVGGIDTHGEVLVGAIGPHNPGTNQNVVNDVHVFDPITELALQTISSPDTDAPAQGGGFGAALAPLGDLNDDGFVDFATSAGFYDLTTSGPPCAAPCASAGRVYIFRSDNSPAPPEPGPPTGPTGPQGPQGVTGPQGSQGPSGSAIVLAGRTLEVEASRARIRRGRRVTLKGLLEAFSNQAACQATQEVVLQRRRRGSLRYLSFARVTTDDDGEFSLRIRPRRTSFYRALVGGTSQCAGAASSRERVNVLAPRRR